MSWLFRDLLPNFQIHAVRCAGLAGQSPPAPNSYTAVWCVGWVCQFPHMHMCSMPWSRAVRLVPDRLCFSPPPRFRQEWSGSIFVFLAFHSVAKDGLWFVRIIERGAGLVDEGGGEVVLSVKWLATINPHKPRFQWAGLLYMNDFRLSNIGHACFTVKK